MWGRQVVVDPRSGAGGVVRTEIAARAPADGYTVVFVGPAQLQPRRGASCAVDQVARIDTASAHRGHVVRQIVALHAD
ncbi:MAG: hypothetical protein IT530_19500 [Burkholderiales bacterium]|nr:hypothetical protein [Burkholderiales bacterium]